MLLLDLLSPHLLELLEFFVFSFHLLLNLIPVVIEAGVLFTHIRECVDMKACNSISREFIFYERLEAHVFHDALLTGILIEILHLDPILRCDRLLVDFLLFFVTMLAIVSRPGTF